MRTAFRATLIPAAAFAILAGPSAAQSHLGVSVGVGSLFDGVSFGFHVADHRPGPAFVGVSLGLGWRSRPVDHSYGIYSRSRGWPGHRGYSAVSVYSCWDYYWDSYWDPWSGWYDDCVVHGPVWYGSRHARSWRHRHGGFYRPVTYVYWVDPYRPPWGPYWAHDPFDRYWDGYPVRGYGAGWGRVRTVYVPGGRAGTVVYRPSPLARAGTTYKEDADVRGATTAQRRPSGTPAMAAPSRPTEAAPQRGVRRPSAAPAARPAPSVRPSDRLTPGRGNAGSPEASPEPARRTPAVRAPATAGAERGRPSVSAPAPSATERARPDVEETVPQAEEGRRAAPRVTPSAPADQERARVSRPSRATADEGARAPEPRAQPRPSAPSSRTPRPAASARPAPAPREAPSVRPSRRPEESAAEPSARVRAAPSERPSRAPEARTSEPPPRAAPSVRSTPPSTSRPAAPSETRRPAPSRRPGA